MIRWCLVILIFSISQVAISKSISISKLKSADIKYRINPFLSDCRNLLNDSPIEKSLVRILPRKGNDKADWLDIAMKLKPGYQVAISAGKIYFKDDGKLAPEVFANKSIEIEKDSAGLSGILIPFDADEDEMRIPLSFTMPDGARISTFLQVKIANEETLTAVLVPLIDLDRQKGLCIRSQAWLGLGLSVFSYSQTISAADATAKFTSMSPFSLSAEYKYFASPSWAIVGSLKSAPGTIKPGEVKSIGATNFRWNTAMLETQYRPYVATFAYREYTFYPFLKLGLQDHQMPRLSIDENINVSLDSINLLNAHVGFGVNIVDKSKYFLETFLNYQTKLSSPGYDIKPSLMFDGSIGVGKMLTQNMALGVFFYGQWHQFDYQSQSGSDTNPGHINYLFSNTDVRLGWTF